MDDNRWMNASAHCSALPDCMLDLHNRAGDIKDIKYNMRLMRTAAEMGIKYNRSTQEQVSDAIELQNTSRSIATHDRQIVMR